jgi:hypothetical protein
MTPTPPLPPDPATSPAPTNGQPAAHTSQLPPITPPGQPETLASWLRTQRLERNLPISEMGRQLRKAAITTGDPTVPSGAILAHYVRRWEAGETGVSERYRLHYCTVLGIPPTQFGPPPPSPPPGNTSSPGSAAQLSPNLVVLAVIPPGCHQVVIHLPSSAAPVAPDLQLHVD